MRSSKPQPRVIQNPQHLIWVKYFEKQSKIPSLPKGSPQELVSIYSQLIQPQVLKSQIYAPPTNSNSNTEDFLIDLFELKAPISPNEFNLMKYVCAHKDLFTKPFKIIKIIGPSIMRILIRFFTNVRTFLTSEQYDKVVLLSNKEEAFNILWISIHIPKPFKDDARQICSKFLNILPNPCDNYNLLISQNYYRELERQCFKEISCLVKYSKQMKPYYVSALGFLMRYVQVILESLGKEKLSVNELENCKDLLTNINSSSPDFINSIPKLFKIKFINSLLLMLTELQHYTNSTNEMVLVFKIALLACENIIKFISNDESLIPTIENNQYYYGIILFPLWSFETFQHNNKFHEPPIQFENEKTSSQPLLDFLFVFHKNNSIPVIDKLPPIHLLEPTNYDVINKHPQLALKAMLLILDDMPNTQIITKIFQYSQETVERILNGDKEILNSMNNHGKDAIIYIWFILAFILNHPMKWIKEKQSLEKYIPIEQRLFLFNKYIFDFSNDEIPKYEHLPRCFIRNELYNVYFKLYKMFDDGIQTLFTDLTSFMLQSHLHICDEILSFLFTLFQYDPVKFVELSQGEILITSVVWYGRALQKTNYTLQRDKLIYFLSILKNKDMCNIFMESKIFVLFIFHFLFDSELYIFYSQLISRNLLLCDRIDCFSVFCEVLHSFFQSIIPMIKETFKSNNFDSTSAQDKEHLNNLLTILTKDLLPVFTEKKKDLRDFIKHYSIITDLTNIIKIIRGDDFQRLALNILKLLMVTLKDDNEFRVQLNRHHDDLYDTALEIFSSQQFQPELLDSLLYFIFEEQTSITDNTASYLIKNAESAIFLHKSTFNKPCHSGVLAFLQSICQTTFTNDFIISRSNLIEVLIDFIREQIDNLNQSFQCISLLLKNHFRWNFKTSYFLQLIGPNKSENWLSFLLDLLYSFIEPQNPENEVTNFIVLSSFRTIILFPKVRIPTESKGFTLIFTFRIDRQVPTYTICSLLTDTNDQIAIFVEKGFLMYVTSNSNGVKLSKAIDISVWYNMSVTIDGHALIIHLNGEELSNAWESFRFGKEPSLQISIGALFTYNNGAQMSFASAHLFTSPVSNDLCAKTTQFHAQKMQTYVPQQSKDLLLYVSPYKVDLKRSVMINQGEKSKHMSVAFDGVLVTKSTIQTVILKTNGIIRLLRQAKVIYHVNKALLLFKELIKENPIYESNILQIMHFDVLSACLLDLQLRGVKIQKDTVNILFEIWNQLKNPNGKLNFFKDIWFNLYLWNLCDTNLFVDICSNIHKNLIIENPKFTSNTLDVLIFFSIIPSVDDQTKRNNLWMLLFSYLNIDLKMPDQEKILGFVENAPEIFSMEFLLHFFGFINLSQNTSKIIWKFIPENLTKLLFRFIFLLNLESTRLVAATYITNDIWLKIQEEYLSLKSHPIFFSTCVLTSQFFDQSYIMKFLDKILSSTDHLTYGNILVNEMPEVWAFYLIARCSNVAIDFASKSHLVTLFAKLFYIALTLSNSFNRYINSLFLFGIQKKVDVAPFIRNILIQLLDLIKKKSNIDTAKMISSIFMYLFILPRSDPYVENAELYRQYGIVFQNPISTKTSNDISIIDIIKTFQTCQIEELFPLQISMRIDAKGTYFDLELAIQFLEVAKNLPSDVFKETVFHSLTLGHLIVFTFCMVIRADPNASGDMTILFEKIFPPDTCDPNLFSLFIFSLYNAVHSLTYWRSTFGRFCQKYSKFFGSYHTIICSQEETIIFTKKDLNKFTMINFGEPSMYTMELFDRYVNYLEDDIRSHLKEMLKYLDNLVDETSTLHDSGIVFIEVMKQMTNIQQSIYQYRQTLCDFDSFDYCNLPNPYYDKFTPPNLQELKPTILYDNHYHPIANSFFDMDFSTIERTVFGSYFPKQNCFIQKDKEFIVTFCELTYENKHYNTLMYMDNEKLTIGGFLIMRNNIRSIIVHSDDVIEVFVKFGIMLHVKLTDLNVKQLTELFPELFEMISFKSPMSIYDYILKYNFLNGKTFNDPNNQPIFPYIDENGNISSNSTKFLSSEKFTLNANTSTFKLMFDLESPTTLQSLHDWIQNTFSNTIKDDEKTTFTDPSQQGSILINSFVLDETVNHQNGKILYVDNNYFITSRGKFGTFTPSVFARSQIKNVENVNYCGDSFVFTTNQSQTLYIQSFSILDELYEKQSQNTQKESTETSPISAEDDVKPDTLIKNVGHIQTFIPFNKLMFFASLRPLNQFDMFGNETLMQIALGRSNNKSITPFTISNRPIIAGDTSTSIGLLAALNDQQKVYICSIFRRIPISFFLLPKGDPADQILLFNSGCIITKSNNMISSYTIDGKVIATIGIDSPVLCICKLELDGYSEFICCGTKGGSIHFLDAHTLHTAKIVNCEKELTNVSFNKYQKKLICTFDTHDTIITSLK